MRSRLVRGETQEETAEERQHIAEMEEREEAEAAARRERERREEEQLEREQIAERAAKAFAPRTTSKQQATLNTEQQTGEESACFVRHTMRASRFGQRSDRAWQSGIPALEQSTSQHRHHTLTSPQPRQPRASHQQTLLRA